MLGILKEPHVPLSMTKKRPATVAVRLESNLLDTVDDEVKRLKVVTPKSRPTRSGAILSLIQQHVQNLQPEDPKVTYEGFLKQSSVFKLRAGNRLALGKIEQSRNIFLRAAAYELLALSVLDSPSDSAIIRHLIEMVECAKRGTGYKSLPDARQGAKLLSTAGSA